MDGPLPAVLALLMVVSLSAVGPVGSGPAAATSTATPVVQQQNTTAFLALPGDELRLARYDSVSLDVAGSVALDQGRIQAEYTTSHIAASFENASSAEERRAALDRSAARIEARIAELSDRERAALEAFNDQRLSTRSYLRELAAIDAEARALESTIASLVRYNRASDEPLSDARIARMKARLVPLSGPVRHEIAAAMRGDPTDSLDVYVETSKRGVVLAMIDRSEFETEFVREAYHADAFDLSRSGTVNFSAASDQLESLYPWAVDHGYPQVGPITNEPYLISAGVYGFRSDHVHGTSRKFDLTAFYDNRTGDVFREFQYKAVSKVPTRTIADETNGTLRLRVNASHPSGPMRVGVADTGDGAPVNATIYVNGQTVATTGENGEYWTVAPRARFNLTVATDNGTVTVEPRA